MSTPTGVHALVRRTHEERVIDVLRTRGALSRGEIADLVGLSRTTLSEIAGSLLARGAIIVVDTDAGHREGSGRPAERLALDPGSGQYMGVDFGHRRIYVAVADASHETIAADSARYDENADWPERLDVAFELIDRLARERGIHFGALQAIGIGVPGPFVSLAARRSSAELPFDAGLQPERTLLAWRRTCLSLAVAIAVAIRFAVPEIGALGVLAGMLALGLCAGVWVLATRRYRTAHSSLHKNEQLVTGAIPVAALATAVILLAGVALAVALRWLL